MWFKSQLSRYSRAPGSSISVSVDCAGRGPLGKRIWGEIGLQADYPPEAAQSDQRSGVSTGDRPLTTHLCRDTANTRMSTRAACVDDNNDRCKGHLAAGDSGYAKVS